MMVLLLREVVYGDFQRQNNKFELYLSDFTQIEMGYWK